MIFSNSSIDAIREKMPHPSLTRIIGEPDYQSLDRLYKEIKANAFSIHSTLGGGNHGHLGMVLTPVAYARHSAAAWVQPVHPGTLNIPNGTSQHQTNHLRDLFNEQMTHFTIADSVKNIINSQIKNAIDDDYIAPEIDSVTGTIIHDIPTTMANLFTEYGQVKTSLIDTKLAEIKSKSYDPAIPLASTFKRIEELVDLADAGKIPFTVQQQISIALELLKTTGKFSSAIKAWINRPVAEHTWVNFKTHFNDARSLMKKTGELDNIQGHNFQANALREIVVEGLNEAFQQNQLPFPFAGYTGMQNQWSLPPSIAPPPTIKDTPSITPTDSGTDDNSVVPPPTDPLAAYYAKMNSTDERFDKMQSQMMDMMKLMTTTMGNKNNGGGGGNRNRQRNSNLMTNEAGHSLYCWSHGLCNHRSSRCRNKADGHQDNATFNNRMGGSEKGIIKKA